jgi:hypothetical protein
MSHNLRSPLTRIVSLTLDDPTSPRKRGEVISGAVASRLPRPLRERAVSFDTNRVRK